MTRSRVEQDGTSASGVAGGVPVAYRACGAVRGAREQWKFTGRQIHWGYTFLVWTRDDGKRFARWVR